MTQTDRFKLIITAWQGAKSLADVVATTKLPLTVLQRSVDRLRQQGVVLKEFPTKPVETVDFVALADFASKVAVVAADPLPVDPKDVPVPEPVVVVNP